MEPESPGMEFFQQAVERRRVKNPKRNKKRRKFMEQFLEHAIIRCYSVTLAMQSKNDINCLGCLVKNTLEF